MRLKLPERFFFFLVGGFVRLSMIICICIYKYRFIFISRVSMWSLGVLVQSWVLGMSRFGIGLSFRQWDRKQQPCEVKCARTRPMFEIISGCPIL